MSKDLKQILLAFIVVVAAVGVLVVKKYVKPEVPAGMDGAVATGLPTLLEIGSTSCQMCKAMAKVTDELEREYRGKLEIRFIDVMNEPFEVQKYEVKTIPTQIFLDPKGRPRFRHEGFFSKEDIIDKWKYLGYDLDAEK